MTTQHFGTDVNTTDFVEQAAVVVFVASASGGPATIALRVAPRPDPGSTLLARRTDTQQALSPITVDGSGYWDAAYEAIPFVDVSADGGVTWITCQSLESRLAAGQAGQSAANALTAASTAASVAGEAKSAAESAQSAVQLLAQQVGSDTGGTTDYNKLDNKPVIPPKSELTVPVVWDGTKYPVPSGYKQRLFIGPPTADPGVLAQDNDEWVKVTP